MPNLEGVHLTFVTSSGIPIIGIAPLSISLVLEGHNILQHK